MRLGKKFGRLALAAVLAACCISGSVSAQECQNCGTGHAISVAPYADYGSPDLFYNYYTQGYANQANAQMYLAPRPVPAHVGNTFYTYQPLYPHEMMWWHKETYHRYYDNSRGLNRTSVHYYGPPVRTAASSIYHHFRIAR